MTNTRTFLSVQHLLSLSVSVSGWWVGGSGLRFGRGRVGLVTATIAADGGRVGDELHRRGAAGAQISPMAGHGRRGFAGILPEDKPRLIFQGGSFLCQALTVGDGQLVGAVWEPVKVTGDKDQWKRKHGHNDQSKTHD